MKSYCIKTNNKKIIDYLLDKIEKINFENIYYCNKEFKIYQNVVIHYTGENIDGFINFVTELISGTIIKFYEEKIIIRIINSNYFYFDNNEKKIILENCKEFCRIDIEEKKEKLYQAIATYIKENKAIVLDGIINFRIQEYIKILDNIVDMAVNQYIIEKEYTEFINLLRAYVNTTESGIKLLHLIYINGESILLDEEKNIVPLSENIFNAKYLSDITFSSNDYALNTLLNMLPKKLEIHIINEEDEFINTLKLIFENRVYICKDCSICKTYRMIKNVKEITKIN